MHTLRARLARPPILVAPGVYDPLTSLIAERAGFDALYVTGAGIAYTRLGRPDIGLVSMSEVVETVTLIRDRVRAHLIVDADTGYGNALNVERTVRLLERAGANAIQIEDQDFPEALRPSRRQSADPGRRNGRQDQGGARRAPLSRNFDYCPHRRHRRRRLRSRDRARPELPRGGRRCSVYGSAQDSLRAPAHSARAQGRPLVANMVEGGKTPPLAAAELQALGFSLVIFPGGIVRAVARTASDYYASLAAHGTTEPFLDRMYDFAALNDVIGTPALIALGKQYEAAARGKKDHGK